MSNNTEIKILEISADDFDASLLPIQARKPGTAAFEDAVRQFYQEKLSRVVDSHSVHVDGNKIRVSWRVKDLRPNAVDEGISALKTGDTKSGILMLELLASSHDDDLDLHFNLGMAYSDLGKLEKAVVHLMKAVELDPLFTNAKVALGVAYTRQEKWEEAVNVLSGAAREEPNNPWALRNLGGALLRLGKQTEVALACLKQATILMPKDQSSWFGLAQAQLKAGDNSSADESLLKVIDLQPFSQISELAKELRSKIATSTFREVGGELRMDAVMYCLGALKAFASMKAEEVKKIGFEIAILGMNGIDVNDPSSKYRLKSLAGTFSGLCLLSIQYTAFKQIEPNTDIGFDLSQEYNEAKQMLEMGL